MAGSLATVALYPLLGNARQQDHTVAGQAKNLSAGVLQFSAVVQQSTALSINLVTGNLLNFGYQTLSENQPNRYLNRVYLWPASADAIPWNSTAQAIAPIELNVPEGDQNLENVTISTGAYILGYAVGPGRSGGGWSEYADVVASAFIPAGLGGVETRQVIPGRCSIKPRFVGVSSMACDFTFLPGYYAKSSGSWIGIWPGSSPSYSVAPKWVTAISVDTDSGTSGINGLSFSAGQKYTLGLFSGGYNADPARCDLKRLVCIANFSTQ